jgi:hypothetical protein
VKRLTILLVFLFVAVSLSPLRAEEKVSGVTVDSEPTISLEQMIGLTKAQIVDTVNRGMGAVKSCYDRELPIQPKLAGRIALRWHIAGMTGRVSRAWLERSALTEPSPSLEFCLQYVVSRLQFPVPTCKIPPCADSSFVEVSYPFLFRLVSGTK